MSGCTPLESALAAVPDEIKTVRGWAPGRIIAEAERCADLISQAAILMWWSEKQRKSQKRRASRKLIGEPGPEIDAEIDPDDVTAALARGLAILAIRPAGVEFAGLHLCDHPDGHGCEPGTLAVDPTPNIDQIKATGAFWTPRTLAEKVALGALEAIAYVPGPLMTADRSGWELLTAEQILSKHIVDITVGAGVFPIATLRYLTARILERADPVTAVLEQHVRARVITNCLYGVDIDPASIGLCRIAVALMVPLTDIDAEITRRFPCGDSLLGVTDIDQLRFMDLDVRRGRAFHGNPVIDVNAVSASGGVETLWLLADLLAGAALSTAGKGVRARRLVFGEVEALVRRVAACKPGAATVAAVRARELIDTGLPAGRPPRNPFHWPLAFPEVFGATRFNPEDHEEF